MAPIPILETERLVLRGFTSADFEPMATFYADPISKFYGGPCNRADAWRRFAVFPGHWQLRGYGPWALETKSTGHFIGICGPWYPEGWIEPEITWALLPEHQGNGYATEAAKRSLQAAYADFGWSTAVSVIAVDNDPSAVLARRLGAEVESSLELPSGPHHVYRHTPMATL